MTAEYDAIVIGAGHNGLIAATYLARAGLRVVVLERRAGIGGCTATEEIFPGCRVDTGAHRIGGFSRRVLRDLDLAQHGLHLVPADPSAGALLPDQRCVLLHRDAERTAAALRDHSGVDADRWRAFTELVADAAGVLEGAYQNPPPDPMAGGARDLASLVSIGGRLRRLGRRRMIEVMRILPMTAAELLDEWFECDGLKGALAGLAISGGTQGPMAAGTALTFVHHHVGAPRGTIRPAVHVRGGTGALATALGAAAERAGVTIRTASPVARLLVDDGRVAGVRLAEGEEVHGRLVVSNADARHTLSQLTAPGVLDPSVQRSLGNIRYRGAQAKVHLRLRTLPRFDALPDEGQHQPGVLVVAPSVPYLERASDDAKYGAVARHPYLEAAIPTLTEPDRAPTGEHLMSIDVQYVPYALREGAWDDARRSTLGDLVVDTLAEHAPSLPDLILDRHVATPADLHQVFGIPDGDPYHGEMAMDQLFFMRPIPECAGYRTPIDALYLCGAGTHPGGGVNGHSGRNAARTILKDWKTSRV